MRTQGLERSSVPAEVCHAGRSKCRCLALPLRLRSSFATDHQNVAQLNARYCRDVTQPTPDDSALSEYLDPIAPRVSAFVTALRDARDATGRHLESGAVREEERTGNWLGAIGYLLLLDQIGTAVEPAGAVMESGGAILRALKWWAPGVTEKGAKAIYALRCALAHDYGLFNKHTDPELQHEFRLHRGTGLLVQLPVRPWQGNYSVMHDPTTVSLRALGDRVEQVVSEVRAAHTRGDLSIARGLSPDDLLQRYSFVVMS